MMGKSTTEIKANGSAKSSTVTISTVMKPNPSSNVYYLHFLELMVLILGVIVFVLTIRLHPEILEQNETIVAFLEMERGDNIHIQHGNDDVNSHVSSGETGSSEINSSDSMKTPIQEGKEKLEELQAVGNGLKTTIVQWFTPIIDFLIGHRLRHHRESAIIDEEGKRIVGAMTQMGGIQIPKPEDLKHWVGTHIIVEFFNISNLELIENADLAEKMTLKALGAGNLTLISMESHQFKPTGVTLVALLMESHLSMHSWPEYAYASVDIFTCGQTANPSRTAEVMRQELNAGQFVVAKMPRGHPREYLLDPPVHHTLLGREEIKEIKFV